MKVSVVVLTYNHALYIREALDSVLAQSTRFPFEIVVAEDFSTDGTRAIVESYRVRFPDRIRVSLSPYNVGHHRTTERALSVASGTYIALLDGDDYWTSSDKLQRQADFLDQHPQCSMCCHDATHISESGELLRYSSAVPNLSVKTLDDILAHNFVDYCSVMFRQGLFGALPEWFYKVVMEDWVLHVLNAQHGHIGYVAGNMATYRVRSGGLWSGMSIREQADATIEFYEQAEDHLGGTYRDKLRRALANQCYTFARRCQQSDDAKGARDLILRGLARDPLNSRLLLLRYCPNLLAPLRLLRSRIVAVRR